MAGGWVIVLELMIEFAALVVGEEDVRSVDISNVATAGSVAPVGTVELINAGKPPRSELPPTWPPSMMMRWR